MLFTGHTKVRVTGGMYVLWAETAGWGILLPFLVKIYAEVELLLEKGEPILLEYVKGEKPRNDVLEVVPVIEMHVALFLYLNREPAKPFHPLYR